jgi:hypothetical protein
MNDTIFVGLDVHKATVAVAVAEGMRGGEVRTYGLGACVAKVPIRFSGL